MPIFIYVIYQTNIIKVSVCF